MGLGLACSSVVSWAQWPWRIEFDRWPDGYSVRGRPATPMAIFELVQVPDAVDGHALRMKADRATGSLLIPVPRLEGVGSFVLRWRWRVLEFPTKADGRDARRDDQAIGVYVGTEGGWRRRALAYRWETETPVGQCGESVYAGGLVRVRWICVRNAKDGAGRFLTEERNLMADWREAFEDSIPSSVAISISCNSQYTGTKASAELDWIELTASTNAAPPAAAK